MSGRGGKDLLLKVESSTPGTFVTIGGLRSKSLSINNEEVDITNHGSNQWKESLDEAGIRSMAISGGGVFANDAAMKQAMKDVISGKQRNYQIIDADADITFEGKFKITSCELAGEYNGEQTWSLSLASSGEVTFDDGSEP
jgi:TP901-1 family phage major tail protein